MRKTRDERLAIYFQRMGKAPAASTFETALTLAARVLKEVEDEFSGEPDDPANWMNLPRMFPPQADRITVLRSRPGVWQAKTKGHLMLIGANGSLEYWRIVGDKHRPDVKLDFKKPGADGNGLPS